MSIFESLAYALDTVFLWAMFVSVALIKAYWVLSLIVLILDMLWGYLEIESRIAWIAVFFVTLLTTHHLGALPL